MDWLTRPGLRAAIALRHCVEDTESIADWHQHKHAHRKHHPPFILAKVINTIFLSPLLITIPCIVSGAALSWFERQPCDAVLLLPNCTEPWEYWIGVDYTIGNAAALPNPLVNQSPASQAGQVIAIYVSVITFQLASVGLGFGGELLRDIIHACKRPRRCLCCWRTAAVQPSP